MAITEADLEAAERWLSVTLAHCDSLRGCQRHQAAANSAASALKFMRVLRTTEAEHGFFSDFLTRPYEGLFEVYL